MKKFPLNLVFLTFVGCAAVASSYAQDDGAVIIVSGGFLGGTDTSADGFTYIRNIPAESGDLSTLPTLSSAGGAVVLQVGSIPTNAGTLTLTSATWTNPITITNGATITAFPFAFQSGSLPISPFDTLQLGSAGSGTLTLSGGTTISNGLLTARSGTLILTGTNVYTAAPEGATLTISPITLSNGSAITNGVVTSSDSDGTVTTNSIPEPSTAILLAGGLALLTRRRQRRTA